MSLPGRRYLNCDGTILTYYDCLANGDNIGDECSHHYSQYLYFTVAGSEVPYAAVPQAGGLMEGEISHMPWGVRLFHAQDPFGNPISFVDKDTVLTG